MQKTQAVWLMVGVLLGMTYSIVVAVVADYIRATQVTRAVRKSIRQQRRLIATLEKVTRG